MRVAASWKKLTVVNHLVVVRMRGHPWEDEIVQVTISLKLSVHAIEPKSSGLADNDQLV